MSTMLQKHLSVEIKAVDEEGRRVTALASTASIDRDEEIILPDGWQLDGFRKNPLFLWGHRHRTADPQDILGRVSSVSIEPAGLLATFEYDTDINQKAALVFDQVRKGTIKAYSVGFMPKSWVTKHSPKEHVDALPEAARKALDEGRAFVVYTAVELVEISQVPIPSNPDALVGASAKAARLQELKQLEEATMEKPVEKAEQTEEKAPDIGAIVKAAVAEAMAPVVDALVVAIGKTAPSAPAPEKAPSAKTAALLALAALPAERLDATLAKMSTEERTALAALLN